MMAYHNRKDGLRDGRAADYNPVVRASTFQYDAARNLTCDGSGTGSTNASACYSYNALGQRRRA